MSLALSYLRWTVTHGEKSGRWRDDLDGLEAAPWAEPADDLGLEQPDHRPGKCVVVAVADAAHRRRDAGALMSRFTRSSGQGAALSLLVVRTDFPRTILCRPIWASAGRRYSGPRRFLRGRVAARPCARRRPGSSPPRHAGSRRAERRRGASAAAPSTDRPAGRVGVVGVRGDRQLPANRLDPVRPAMIVDEGDPGFHQRSSSATAKYAFALRRISFACRNSRTSSSSAFSRVRSSVVTLSRSPPSRSA